MYLIVGLGNPGRQYEATRHHMGFDVIDKLGEEYQIHRAVWSLMPCTARGSSEGSLLS